MQILPYIFTAFTALTPKEGEFPISHAHLRTQVMLLLLWIQNGEKRTGPLHSTCTHWQHLTINIPSHESRIPFFWQREECWLMVSLFCIIPCGQAPFGSAFPNGKEHTESVAKQMLYCVLTQLHKHCLLPQLWNISQDLYAQRCFWHVLLHLTEWLHVPVEKSLKDYLIFLRNKDTKAMSGRPTRNKTPTVRNQTQKQMSSIFSILSIVAKMKEWMSCWQCWIITKGQ